MKKPEDAKEIAEMLVEARINLELDSRICRPLAPRMVTATIKEWLPPAEQADEPTIVEPKPE